MATETAATAPRDIRQLAELIKGIRVAMLTCVCSDGSLRSRPIATQERDFDGTLWFFTRAEISEAGNAEGEGQVNVTYENPGERVYVSISGRATRVADRQQIELLWNDDVATWFPEGMHDPQLALLRVDADKWECWDAQSNVMMDRSGQLKDIVPEVEPEKGDHTRLDIGGTWISQDVGTQSNRNEVPEESV